MLGKTHFDILSKTRTIDSDMAILSSLLLFVVGFYVLIKGAGVLVNGSTSMAKYFNISSWFIGVAIVGVGTSLPEFSVSVASALNGDNIGLGTIIGTNAFNILIILGLSALFIPLEMKKQWVMKDFVIHIMAILAASIVVIFPIFGDPAFIGVTQDEGLFLFASLIIWLWFLFHRKVSEEETADYKVFTLVTSVVMVIAGIIGVFIGGMWVVGGAKTIAELFGASPALIGLTIVAVGTSLPELTVSVVALFKRTTAIAVGNIIGSSIINFLGIIGFTALVQQVQISEIIKFDILVVLAASIALFLIMFVGKRYVLSRPKGLLFVVLYIIYLSFIIMRG